mgnify:CR=1 FL=1
MSSFGIVVDSLIRFAKDVLYCIKIFFNIGLTDFFQRLFHPFIQAGSQPARQGTGLGLVISRTLCELMHGSLQLHSTPGHGTRVTVRLPLTLADSPGQAPLATLEPPVQDSQALHILVVDDDSFQCKLLERLLGNAGYETIVACSGAEALALLGRQHPDLILMDVALPDLNGVEITQRLKANPGTAAIPIMMITGHSERQVLAASLKAGAVDFLVKPFDREVLLQKITHHLAH